MNQTNKTGYVYPDGLHCDVRPVGDLNWTDVGVFAGGVVFTNNFDKDQVDTGNAGKTAARYKNFAMAIAPSEMLTWNPEMISKLSGGLMQYTAIAGTLVSGATQTIAAGYTYLQAQVINGKNANGTAPTIASVKQDPTGANTTLVLDTDYFVVKSQGGWGIYIKDTATSDNAFPVLITYSYTPAAAGQLTMGTTSKVATYFEMRLRHYTDSAFTTYDYEILIHKVSPDSGIGWNKKGANEDGVDVITASFTGEIDTTLADNAQLWTMIQNAVTGA
jgi:hypothetical protein